MSVLLKRVRCSPVKGTNRASCSVSTLAILFCLLSITQLHAIFDTNHNTLSDLWEIQFNSQQLFDPQNPDHQPSADPDGDGWTNLEEATAGTDPFISISLGGMLRLDFAHHPATYGPPDLNGVPELDTPEAISISWPTVVGKLYQPQYSSDLTSEAWTDLPDVLHGYGQVITLTVPLTQANGLPPDTIFWRITITDIDTDGDGLTKAEENALGSNDQLADSDGDGTDDLYEAQQNTNLANNQDGGSPIAHIFQSRWIQSRKFDQTASGGGMAGVARLSQDSSSEGDNWMALQEQAYQSVANADDFGALSSAASTFPLPETWQNEMKGLWWKNITISPEGMAPELEDFTAGQMEHRIRINKNAPAGGYPHPLQVLKLHWTRDSQPFSAWTRDTTATNTAIITDAVVPQNERLSDIIQYSAIPNLGVNRAISLHAIRFEEVAPDSGFNDSVRYLPSQRMRIPMLCLANSIDEATPPNAQVKVRVSPADHPLDLEVEFAGNHLATVTPNTISGPDLTTVMISMNLPLSGETPVEGELKINGVKVLDLVAFPRRTVTVAFHKISLINDDIEIEHTTQHKETFVTTTATIAPGKGLPQSVCIRRAGTSFYSEPAENTDDYFGINPEILTGNDGICQSFRAMPPDESSVPDDQVIALGQGKPDVPIIGPGPNGELNTAPNEPLSNIPLSNGGIHNPQDDVVIENAITTGPDGIRQTSPVVERVECVNVPTQPELQDYLDKVFGKQINIWFTITNYLEADAAYDVGTTDGEHANFPKMAIPNRRFDFFLQQMISENVFALSREEQIVQVASKDAAATFNVYFLPTDIAMRTRINGVSINSEGMAAFARSNLRTPYVEAKGGPFAATRKELLKTVAHEMAHSAFFGPAKAAGGLHHPWHTDDEADDAANGPITPYHPEDNYTNLDMDTDRLRLMWYSRQKIDPSETPPGKLTHEESWKLHTDNDYFERNQ